ncbi:DUF3291 domain-containing protein [Methylobacterium sp. E-016]|uniref:DUF3291 domain-containing protein n=1 Tax=unclassified Methylobacterium TaxID=2615210 RepID=UPI001FBAE758|nr:MULTISPECIES: DUF3291 domain-containing protein [unclassified Methylobacterium]MCJ2007811.1 DUF3291 domain-containing protein [Methylobacterium sp. J-092]MCJ2079605.1 DUF3291 domain-containing protein [Methylobacterium sp. E-016]
MLWISLTRLRLRSWRFVPGFAWYGVRSGLQARNAAGYRDGALLDDAKLTFWTVTAWADEAAMRAYVLAGDHRAAMGKLSRWCDEASVAHWIAPGLPDWPEADRRMRETGRPSKVRHPSPAHAALADDPPRTPRGGRLPRAAG